jgi:starvation-inducible DNA-binding protein
MNHLIIKGGAMGRDHNDGFNPKMQVDLQPNIGLDDNARKSVVGLLNVILADEAILTVKTRSAHWNIHGVYFLELNTLYISQTLSLNAISDEIAERVRILGGFAIGSLQEFLDHTRLGEQSGKVPHILHLLADQESTIRFLREDANLCSEEFEDQGTFRMLVDIIRLHEKMAWMLQSYIHND